MLYLVVFGYKDSAGARLRPQAGHALLSSKPPEGERLCSGGFDWCWRL